jgi:phage/plasmid-like protein (TIGR03299 family)
MSQETINWLNNNTLIGYTEKRGNAWHYRAEEQGDQSNHYNGAIPVEDVKSRLFDWKPLDADITATALTDDGVLTTVDPDRKAILRSDTGAIMGIFSKSYRSHDYQQWLIENVQTILDSGLAIGSAGLLRNGAQAWVQVEMADTVKGIGGIDFRPFITAATSLDGSLATSYVTGSQVVVCDNTLSAALFSADKKFKLKHTRHSLNKILAAREALDIVNVVEENFNAQLEILLNNPVSGGRFAKFAEAYAGGEDVINGKEGRSRSMAITKRDSLFNLWDNDIRVNPWKGTEFGVIQAVNTYVHHVGIVRGDTRAQRNAGRVLTGGVDTLDKSTLDLLATV